MNNAELAERGNKVFIGTYSRFPAAMVKGSGCRLWDADGREYLDFLAGIAVCSLGHCHPRVTEAISRQAADLVHVSNLFHTKMLLKEITLQNYLFNTDAYELPPRTRLQITENLRREMIEIFSGSNVY